VSIEVLKLDLCMAYSLSSEIFFYLFIYCCHYLPFNVFSVSICDSFVTFCCLFPHVLRFVGHTTGSKTYYFKDDLARMEEALVCFTMDTLLKKYVS